MAGLITYQHSQLTESDEWVINHKLGVYPAIDVYVIVNGTLTKIIPADIMINDLNTATVKFTRPFAGTARLV